MTFFGGYSHITQTNLRLLRFYSDILSKNILSGSSGYESIFCVPWVPIETLFHEKVPYWVPKKAQRSHLYLATVRYHALGAYAKSVYLVGVLLREKNQGR